MLPLMNTCFILGLATALLLQTGQPKFEIATTDSRSYFLNSEKTLFPEHTNTQIKWTWQLPAAVLNSFSKSNHANWFIEKMIQYKAKGGTIYRFYLNNGNLLDGDHYDSFLQSAFLDIADNGDYVSGFTLHSNK